MHPQKPTLLSKLVGTLTSTAVEPSYRNASLLGLVLDVALRLKDRKGAKGAGKVVVEDVKVRISAITREVSC